MSETVEKLPECLLLALNSLHGLREKGGEIDAYIQQAENDLKEYAEKRSAVTDKIITKLDEIGEDLQEYKLVAEGHPEIFVATGFGLFRVKKNGISATTEVELIKPIEA